MPKLTINAQEVETPPGSSVLEAIRSTGATLPTLCYWEGLPAYGACRLCLVELVEPRREVIAACSYPAEEGMVVETHGEKAQSIRKLVLEFMLARCPESQAIRDLALTEGVAHTRFQVPGEVGELCVLCGLCVRVCRDAVGAAAISFTGRGSGRKVDSPFHLQSEDCIGCGACAAVCPTGAIHIEDIDGQRYLHTWNTVVKLQPCRACGKPYAPEPMAFLKEGALATENSFVTCPSCRRKAAASQFDTFKAARVAKGI
jgi:NADH dehydrogenase/NADH:ubiquinone oxidoreductase subunit G